MAIIRKMTIAVIAAIVRLFMAKIVGRNALNAKSNQSLMTEV